jgi:GNAT superfamily N-acetyltransferase
MLSADRLVDDQDLIFSTLSREVADQIAALHAEALPGDILPALGRGFLARYYATVLGADSQIVIGATCSAGLIGFCQLSFSPMSVRAVMKSDPLALLPIAKLALVHTKMLVDGIAMTLHRPKEVMALPEISFIVVRSGHRGRGIGKRMVQVANGMAASRGCPRVFTKTSNKVARAMYETAFGARVVATATISERSYWYLAWDTRPGANNDHVAS